MTKTTKVVNIRTHKYNIYIGRRNSHYKLKQSKWANPYHIGKDGTREEVITKYRDYVLQNKELMDSLHELIGQTLGCWCKPLDCHGDVLVELIEEKYE